MTVRDLDGNIVGYTRWFTVPDTMDTYRIYRTSAEAFAPENRMLVEPGARCADDVLVRLCFDDDITGWRVWANKELTLITDAGGWYNPDDWCGGDYGYTDVVEPDEYAKKFYEPIPVRETP